MLLTLTPLADAGVVLLPPDIVWQRADGSPAGAGFGVRGDFALAANPADGAGALVARDPLRTAVILCLMTDARVADYEIDAGRAGDRRGYPGDGVDIDGTGPEQAMGSKLWLLRRMDLNDQTAMWAQAEARRALAPLVAQGAAARVEARATPDHARDALGLWVGLYARDGAQVYAEQFDLLWRLATGRS